MSDQQSDKSPDKDKPEESTQQPADNQKHTGFWIMFIIILLLLAAGLVALLLNQSDDNAYSDQNQETAAQEESQQPQDSQSNTQQPESLPTTGIIRGSMTYPSEGIPDDVIVCAENVRTAQETCTSKRINDNSFAYGIGYVLDVPVGEYKVLARFNDSVDENAYYDEYIRLDVLEDTYKDPCQDGSLIEPLIVTVVGGETVSDIVVGDWYYPFGLTNCGQ